MRVVTEKKRRDDDNDDDEKVLEREGQEDKAGFCTRYSIYNSWCDNDCQGINKNDDYNEKKAMIMIMIVMIMTVDYD